MEGHGQQYGQHLASIGVIGGIFQETDLAVPIFFCLLATGPLGRVIRCIAISVVGGTVC